jgi:hypothetical protein
VCEESAWPFFLFTLLSAVTQSYFGHRVLRYLGPSGTLMGRRCCSLPPRLETPSFR